MNNIIDQTTMTTDAIFGTTLEVVLPSGQLKVRTQGITSNELATNSVTTNSIADVNVTTAKIADLNVTTGKVADSAITAVKLATDSVETVKIKNANVTAAKLDGAQTGTAPIYGIRAWVVFDLTRNASGGSDTANTNRFIYASGNVSSVTKTNTGEFNVNFTTALPSVNYAYSGSGTDTDTAGDVNIGRANGATKTASVIRLRSLNSNASGENFPEVSLMFIA